MRKIVSLAAAIVLVVTPTWSFCSTLPRLVCAEYSNSELVVIARLIRTRHVAREDDVDVDIYTFNVGRTLRGKSTSTIRIREENNSGRASFNWEFGQSYLLFLNSNSDGTWWLYGCGNSGPLNGAGYVLKVIESLKARQGGLIQGVVLSDQPPASKAGIKVLIHGQTRNYVATTDGAGEFKVHVAAGTYKIRPMRAGFSYETSIYSNEDPRKVTLENGGCAQVTFEETTKAEMSH